LLGGQNLLKMSLRQGINLVAYSLTEQSEGEHAEKLNQLFKGEINYAAFSSWYARYSADNGASSPPVVTQDLLDELAEFKEANNGNRSVTG